MTITIILVRHEFLNFNSLLITITLWNLWDYWKFSFSISINFWVVMTKCKIIVLAWMLYRSYLLLFLRKTKVKNLCWIKILLVISFLGSIFVFKQILLWKQFIQCLYFQLNYRKKIGAKVSLSSHKIFNKYFSRSIFSSPTKMISFIYLEKYIFDEALLSVLA